MNWKPPDPGRRRRPGGRSPRIFFQSFRPRIWLAVLPLAFSSSLASAHNPAGTTTAEGVPQEVLNTLLATPLGRTLPSLAYSVNQAQTFAPNAFSYPDGKLYVTQGTNYLLGAQQGLWAALLSHELGHVLLHHAECLPAFKGEMQHAYLRTRLHVNEQAEMRAPGASPPAAWLAEELDRHGRHEEEFESDIIGLMLMAEAGYHPQFFLILGRDLNFYLRTSRVTSFFVRHPDWGSREKRLLEVYDAALGVFNSRWPDIAQSPGGKLPALGSIEKVAVTHEGDAMLFNVPFRLANPDHKPVRVALALLEDKKRVPSAIREYRWADGYLVVNSDLPSTSNGPGSVVLRLPLAAVGTRTRHLKAVVFLATDELPIAVSQLTLDLPSERN